MYYCSNTIIVFMLCRTKIKKRSKQKGRKEIYMLELKNIRKSYKIGEIETKALDDVSISFREREMVAILGASGSGKTTLLNIVGGLDRYDSGEMIIKGKNTKNFKDKDWDAYRNNSIGFVFQSYNLISHLSIVANVEISMSLSGVSAGEKRRRAIKVLEDVGLKDHLHKRPTQLSGGQMQRVAIARALVNDPEILLCDEPTGALDTVTSVQIMDLIKSIAKERLVIMVTHNPELADKYSDRIVRFQDGKIISDTNPYKEHLKDSDFNLKKTSMSFFTALNISLNNILTKKGRTFLTALASSIGIIGIAVILSLSTGFQVQIDKFQRDSMANFPIIISQQAMVLDRETMQSQSDNMGMQVMGKVNYVDSDEVYLYDSMANAMMHVNKFTDEYMQYVKNIEPAICEDIGYTYVVGMNLLRNINGEIKPVSFAADSNSGMMSGLSSYPVNETGGAADYLEKNYDLLAGAYPTNETEVVLVINNSNKVESSLMKALGFNTEGVESIKFADLIGTEFKLISNNDYYVKTDMDSFLPGKDYVAMYNDADSITLTLCAVIRQSPDVGVGVLNNGLIYSDALSQRIINTAKDSDIVKAQLQSENNIITMQPFEEGGKDMFIAYLGGTSVPVVITVYPTSFEAKDSILEYLDAYNENREAADVVVYSDMAAIISNLSGGIISAITIVLIAFAAISLVVSLIMVAIITYTSVLERTKEIGILKALGARKKDITRVFNAETFIIGVFSGTLGIVIAYLLTFPINILLYSLTDLTNVAQLQLIHAVLLVVISTTLTVLGGNIPARMASKKDAVVALRSE